MTTEDIFKGLGVEIELPDRQSFLKIEETLTRIGVASKKDRKLYQSCHILHKKGRYSIIHFKEMFQLDGKPTSISSEDLARRNKIAHLLEDWNLCRIIDGQSEKLSDIAPMSHIKVLNYQEKNTWTLQPKYSIGSKRKT